MRLLRDDEQEFVVLVSFVSVTAKTISRPSSPELNPSRRKLAYAEYFQPIDVSSWGRIEDLQQHEKMAQLTIRLAKQASRKSSGYGKHRETRATLFFRSSVCSVALLLAVLLVPVVVLLVLLVPAPVLRDGVVLLLAVLPEAATAGPQFPNAE